MDEIVHERTRLFFVVCVTRLNLGRDICAWLSRAERKCTGGAEQNCTTERRRIRVEIRGAW